MPDHDDRSRAPEPPGDEVTDLLLAAFESEVRTGPVDERSLATGALTRVRRRRSRRRVRTAVAAVVLVAAVPLTLQVWPGGSVSTTPVGTPTGSESRLPERPASPSTPPTTPTSSGPADPAAQEPPPPLPRTLATVPTGVELISDSGPYQRENSPLAGLGVTCDLTTVHPSTVSARKWQWNAVDAPADAQEGVTLLVTRWPTGTAQAAFDGLGSDGAACRFGWAVTPFPVSVQGADQTWAATTDFTGDYQGGPVHQVSAAARVGDLAVGVSVESSRPAREEELTSLLSAAVADLRADQGSGG
ncbi:hypothetical protein AB1207_10195 [Kineococcus endophyticus]|uniref:PknH-like protein n=1 Tax=Kineococcus endophyticus TaxID=1181883 RepID=A0ABV3P662_9ACTN